MSKSIHGGYSGTRGAADKHHDLADNLPQLTKAFPVSPEGYFGERGTGKARRISSDNPLETARDFYEKATEGAVQRGPMIQQNNGPVPRSEAAILKDGSRVQIREVSHSDGTPAVEICIVRSGFVKPQKIHFIPKGGNK